MLGVNIAFRLNFVLGTQSNLFQLTVRKSAPISNDCRHVPESKSGDDLELKISKWTD